MTALPSRSPLEAQLLEAGIDRTEIDAAMAPWHNANAVDLMRPSIESAFRWLHNKAHSLQAQVHALSDANQRDDPKFALLVSDFKNLESLGNRFSQLPALPALAIPKAIENILVESTVLTDHEKAILRGMVDEDLRAMQHYLRTKSFLDEQAWIQGDPLNA